MNDSNNTLGPLEDAGNGTSSGAAASDVMQYIYRTIGSVGVVGNFLVVVVILSSPALKSRLSNTFIVSQSLIDLCTSIFLLLTTMITEYSVHDDGLLGQLYCRLWLTKVFLWGFLFSSTYNLMALTIERYLGVVHPILHKVAFTKTKARAVLVLVWFWGHIVNLAHLVPSTIIKDGYCLLYSSYPSDLARQAVGIIVVTFFYFIPLLCLIYCYGRMALVLMRRMPMSSGETSNENQNESFRRAQNNVIKTLALVGLLFFLCWTCNQVIYFIHNLGYHISFTSDFYHFTVVAIYFNCCVNPFIYALKYEQFQEAAKRLLCSCLVGRNDTAKHMTNSKSNLSSISTATSATSS